MKMSQTESKVYKWMCTVRERFWKILSSAFRRCGTGDKWTTEKNDHMPWWRCVKRACDGVQVWNAQRTNVVYFKDHAHICIYTWVAFNGSSCVWCMHKHTRTHTRAERSTNVSTLNGTKIAHARFFFNACKSVRVEKRYTEGKSVGTVQCSNFLVNRTRMTQLCINFSVCIRK